MQEHQICRLIGWQNSQVRGTLDFIQPIERDINPGIGVKSAENKLFVSNYPRPRYPNRHEGSVLKTV